jgi:hypothetical protein
MSNKKLTKKEKICMKEDYDKRVPIFRVKCNYGSNNVKLNVLGSVIEGTKITDQLMEFETSKEMEKILGKNIYHICDYDGYTIVGKMFNCNIGASYLINNKKLPIFYMATMYEKKFITGFIPNIYLYFVIDDKTMEEINNTPKNYINRFLSGHYILEIIPDEDFMEKFTEYIKPIIEDKLFVEELSQIKTDFDIENLDKEFYENIKIKTAKKIEEYNNLLKPHIFGSYTAPKKIINDYIKPICNSELFKDMLKAGLKIREKERQKQSIETYNFKPPKRVFNLEELKKNPDQIDILLNNSDSNSDCTDYSE